MSANTTATVDTYAFVVTEQNVNMLQRNMGCQDIAAELEVGCILRAVMTRATEHEKIICLWPDTYVAAVNDGTTTFWGTFVESESYNKYIPKTITVWDRSTGQRIALDGNGEPAQ